MTNTLHIACAARIDYVPHSASMLHSVLSHSAGEPVHIHFLHGDDLPGDYCVRLAGMVEAAGGEISFLPISDDLVSGLRTREGLPAAHWYRIFLPRLLPELERVLYLDGDLIARESVRPLWQKDLGDNYLAAVTNVFQRDHVHRPADLGLPPDQSYFNSGVLLMNLELMRREGCTAALVDWAHGHWEKLAWPEQDALNVVLGGRRVELRPRWNCMNSILLFPWSADVFGAEAVEEARRNPAIRHFEGPSVNKPWHYMCERDMRQLYFAHRRHTPWPEYALEGTTLRNRLKRFARGLQPKGLPSVSA